MCPPGANKQFFSKNIYYREVLKLTVAQSDVFPWTRNNKKGKGEGGFFYARVYLPSLASKGFFFLRVCVCDSLFFRLLVGFFFFFVWNSFLIFVLICFCFVCFVFFFRGLNFQRTWISTRSRCFHFKTHRFKCKKAFSFFFFVLLFYSSSGVGVCVCVPLDFPWVFVGERERRAGEGGI